jgi:SAM-dependent methyltransferase
VTEKKPNPGAAMWNDRFSQPDPIYGEKPNAYLVAKAALWKPGCKVLVPGDGYGRNGIWLARHGFQVRTVDISPVGVERARVASHAAGVSISIEEADLATWNWPVAEFDAVASIFVHLPPDTRAGVHSNMIRALKPGGPLILEAFSPAQLRFTSGGPKDVALLYTVEMLRKDFAGAETMELEEKEIELDEGWRHSGPAAVIHGVFQKREKADI